MNNLITTLAVLLVGCQAKDQHRFEYRVYEVIDHLLEIQAWGQERKADFYALLVETITVNDTMVELEAKVAVALAKSAERFYG